MIDVWLVVGVALGLIVGGLVLMALVLLVGLADEHRSRRDRRRRRSRRREQIETEGHDAVEAWGEQIPMVWPSRAPGNGTPFEDGGQQETSA